jgi:hypothetical protein
MGLSMSYSSRKIVSPKTKYLYNKWRVATLACNIVGLMLFLFALGIGGLTDVLMVASCVVLWAGVLVARQFKTEQEGKPLHTMAFLSYWISVGLAVVLSVLAVITIVR